MTVDLAKLRALAEAATPGPWDYRAGDIVQLTDSGKGYPLNYYPDSRDVIDGRCAECGTYTSTTDCDAAFIAAAHPQAVLALIDEVKRLRATALNAADWLEANTDKSARRFHAARIRSEVGQP